MKIQSNIQTSHDCPGTKSIESLESSELNSNLMTLINPLKDNPMVLFYPKADQQPSAVFYHHHSVIVPPSGPIAIINYNIRIY